MRAQLGQTQLLASDFGFDAKVGKLVAEALGLDAQVFAFLLACADLLLQHDASLDCDVVFGFELFE